MFSLIFVADTKMNFCYNTLLSFKKYKWNGSSQQTSVQSCGGKCIIKQNCKLNKYLLVVADVIIFLYEKLVRHGTLNS